MKRFLVSTTIGHNPGDELIWMGIKNLLQQGLHIDADYFYYNRNPDLQVGNDRVPQPGTVGNYYCNEIDLKHFDGVIIAGSPEWFGGPMKPLFQAIIKTNIPVYFLGVGLGVREAQLSDLDKVVLANAKRIITRSQETTDFLTPYGIESFVAPCPALFSAMFGIAKGYEGTTPALVLQKPGTEWHEIEPSYVADVQGTAGLDVLTVHKKEFEYYANFIPGVRYAASGGGVLKMISRYSSIRSTRLHVAIAAVSMGIPSVVIGNKDFRITTALGPYTGIIPCVGNLFEAAKANLSDKKTMDIFKFHWWDKWKKVLIQAGLPDA